jgi:hypothetical protein
VALVAARFSAGALRPSCRLPGRVALRGLTPACLTFGARLRPACAAPARAALGFLLAFAAPRVLGAAAVLAAFPREEAPDPLASTATGLGAAFRAAPRFAPAALPLVAAGPGAGARRAFRGAAVLEAVPPTAPAVLARVAAGLVAAFGAPERPMAAVPGLPVLAAAVGGAAPRRFGATLVLLPPFAGASAVRALPASGFAVTLPDGGPAAHGGKMD